MWQAAGDQHVGRYWRFAAVGRGSHDAVRRCWGSWKAESCVGRCCVRKGTCLKLCNLLVCSVTLTAQKATWPCDAQITQCKTNCNGMVLVDLADTCMPDWHMFMRWGMLSTCNVTRYAKHCTTVLVKHEAVFLHIDSCLLSIFCVFFSRSSSPNFL